MPNLSLSLELNLALEVLKRVKSFYQDNFSELNKVESSIARDIKISGDFAIHELVTKFLSEKSTYPILSEESSSTFKQNTSIDSFWVLDPIDGSLNFARGVPFYCFSLSFVRNGTPQVGLIYDFVRDELFYGEVGLGAFLNDKAINLSQTKNRAEAILATGVPTYLEITNENLKPFLDLFKSYKKLRWFGSAALSLSYVASGRVDCYQENEIKLWDVAAGIALIKALGGKVQLEKSKKDFGYFVYAGNEHL